MKRYNLINNSLGWLCFVIAAVTYLLTLEPTASFWDCPEFISQGYKLEIGHPPGNPIFMLTARFFVTLFGGGAQTAALAVNTMSGLLSAGTILLLFWTITHLVKKLVVKDDATEVSLVKTLVIMGSGLCGALAYTWSDTFWFSAVEGEVYAFSSFCTALVFWLALKWENRAEQPHSDRYLILIAYVIGISIAVHLLNLLCIPAIVLVFYYKKFKDTNVKGSLLALVVSAVIIALILYGLVPGFVKVAGFFEIFFVNSLGMSYNMGVLIYAIITVIAFVWTIRELAIQKSATRIKVGSFISIILSGMPFIGHGVLIPVVLIIALAVYLMGFCKRVPVRVFNVIITGIFVIFIGYSSYALLLIRATANTPMNQNAPDNVFALASYLNREQYGDRPLFYGQNYTQQVNFRVADYDETGQPIRIAFVEADGKPETKPASGIMYQSSAPVDNGENTYTKVTKTSPDEPDRYVDSVAHHEYVYSPDVMTILPRMYSSDPNHVKGYVGWAESTIEDLDNLPRDKRKEWASRENPYDPNKGYVLEKELLPYLDHVEKINQGTYDDGTDIITYAWRPSFMDNLRFFVNYQLNYMYWRYFMWNFAGRQNDIAGNGEPHLGNWISGIPFIDNARLGDQSLLPDEYGKDNKGHNVFYMLPLLMGIFGLLWQSLMKHKYAPTRGIEQFWVVFFLFFMTGIAIVLYLNQTPGQPRERDYAFAGSFYAFAIWIGMGVAAIHAFITYLIDKKNAKAEKKEAAVAAAEPAENKAALASAILATVIGIAIPLQMVSQTWDDHDRSGRYTTRDLGMNYLSSLDDNAIIFTNGDNDTFPLWYAQEVEGYRTDVKVINLMYLTTSWYANQSRMPSYEAEGAPMYARPEDYAYDQLHFEVIDGDQDAQQPIEVSKALREFYTNTSPHKRRLMESWIAQGADIDPNSSEYKYLLTTPNMYAKLDSASTFRAFGKYPDTVDSIRGAYMPFPSSMLKNSGDLSSMLSFDIIANSASNGWKRPVYFATTVPTSYYLGFQPYMYSTGMASQVTPFHNNNDGVSPIADKAYSNIVGRFRWGGLDKATSAKDLYLDETVRRMVTSTRMSIIEINDQLIKVGSQPAPESAKTVSKQKGLPVPANHFDMARNLLDLMVDKLRAVVSPYDTQIDVTIAEQYARLAHETHNLQDLAKAKAINDAAMKRYSQLVRYALSLDPNHYRQFGASERRAMNCLMTSLQIANFVDLETAYQKKANPDEQLVETMDYLSDILGYSSTYGTLYAYLCNLSDSEINDYADSSEELYQASQIRLAHKLLGVDADAHTRSLTTNGGFTTQAWVGLLYPTAVN
jgi:hypothetical protein